MEIQTEVKVGWAAPSADSDSELFNFHIIVDGFEWYECVVL